MAALSVTYIFYLLLLLLLPFFPPISFTPPNDTDRWTRRLHNPTITSVFVRVMASHESEENPETDREEEQPLDEEAAWKVADVRRALKTNDRLLMKTCAVSEGGFRCSKRLRVAVWCKLARVAARSNPQDRERLLQNQSVVRANENYRQVILDVERSLKRFPPSVEEARRISYQDSLTNVIIMVLDDAGDGTLHYYQGYHDVCLTFLLAMDDEDVAYRLIKRVSHTHLRFFMEKTMNTTCKLLEIIYLVLKQEDRQLYDHMIRSEVGTIFSLSWVITWFSHVLNDLDDILRLFDFFLATHFMMPIYMTISILLYKREEILLIDCDMASMHKYLTNIPTERRLPIDQLVRDSLFLAVRHPPEETIERQREMERNALRDDDTTTTVATEMQRWGITGSLRRFLRRNLFSLTFVGIFTAIIYQFYMDYFDYRDVRR